MEHGSIQKLLRNILICVLSVCLMLVILRLFNVNDHIVYTPFSGKVFDFDASQVEMIWIRDQGDFGELTTMEEIEPAVQVLNNLRSHFWLPKINLLASGGWDCGIRVDLKDGRSFLYTFGSSSISAENIIYWFFENQMDYFLRLV